MNGIVETFQREWARALEIKAYADGVSGTAWTGVFAERFMQAFLMRHNITEQELDEAFIDAPTDVLELPEPVMAIAYVHALHARMLCMP